MLTKFLRYQFSNSRKIYTPEASKSVILNTTSRVAYVAGITLGPMGRNVLIQNQIRQQPRITKDGVTVVKHLQFQHPFQNAVTTLIKKSVQCTNKFAGDGTTSSTIMIGSIVLMIGSCTSREIKQGLKIAREISLDYLQSVKRIVEKKEELFKVAMISTNGDEKVAGMVSEALWKCENVTVERSDTRDTHVQYFSGFKFVRGIPHPEFKNKGDKIIYNYPIVVTSRVPLQSTKQIIKILEMGKKARKQVMIFGEKISQNIIGTLIYNKRKNILESCAIEIPPLGELGVKYLDMVSQSTGAFMFDKFTKSIEDIQWEDVGKAIRITVDEFQTQIRGKKKQNQLSAIIYAGGSTETVALEMYDKVVDSMNSVRTAQKKGVVAGAGLTYWNLSLLLEQYQGEYQIGVKVLAQALKAPRKKLFQTIPPQKKPFQSKGWVGYNIKTQQFEDMFETGIIDSVEVCRNVIIDSISLASQLIDVEIGIIRTEDSSKNLMKWDEIKKKYSL